ncbi:hypothetical protein K0M31_020359 [Melipona bicolor]|uniref:Uncharacterized protein n=1 Tax=Melipona bicolor TaxID=60889 RepID=A0AA40G1E5_9HYME|nr:hypothetical protein K0M31_020359 [Melipona bicolor]
MDVSSIEAFEIALEYCFTFENRNETTFARIYGLTAYMCTENVATQTFELIIQAWRSFSLETTIAFQLTRASNFPMDVGRDNIQVDETNKGGISLEI